jgi:hypothetical protein
LQVGHRLGSRNVTDRHQSNPSIDPPLTSALQGEKAEQGIQGVQPSTAYKAPGV